MPNNQGNRTPQDVYHDFRIPLSDLVIEFSDKERERNEVGSVECAIGLAYALVERCSFLLRHVAMFEPDAAVAVAEDMHKIIDKAFDPDEPIYQYDGEGDPFLVNPDDVEPGPSNENSPWAVNGNGEGSDTTETS